MVDTTRPRLTSIGADMSFAGMVELPPGLIGKLLGLPSGQQAVGCAVDEKGHLQLLIVGRGMPAHEPRTRPATVCLAQDTAPNGDKMLSWLHDPEKKWRRPK